MHYFFKVLSIYVVFLFLTACIDVDDNGNTREADALEEQNSLLREQITQQENMPATVNLYGTVVDANSGELVDSGTVTVSIGSTVREPVEIISGVFEVTELPSNSSYELYVQGGDGYLGRAFYSNTSFASQANVFQDAGVLTVSKAETFQFRVVQQGSEEIISGLTFQAESHVGASSKSLSRRHISTFDNETGIYSIVLPADITSAISAEVDLNGDDISDYDDVNIGAVVDNSFTLSVFDLARLESDILLAINEENSVSEPQIYSLRISVLDEFLNSIPEASAIVNDALNTNVVSIYDETAQQHTLDIRFLERTEIMIPSFTVDDTNYSSVSISMSPRFNQQDQFNISIQGSTSEDFYQLSASQQTINLVVKPTVIEFFSTDLEVLVRKNTASSISPDHKVFYSKPVGVIDGEVSLSRVDAVTVVKGNDSPTDFVLPGTTNISQGGVYFPVTVNLSLNNTLLTLAGTNNLIPGFSYRYNIGNILDERESKQVALSDDSNIFDIPVSETFDINSLVVDNDNFTTEGLPITSQNTAGVVSSPFNSSDSVYLYLPLSISQLENFTISVVGVNDDGVLFSGDEDYNIVRLDDVRVSKIFVAKTAQNENIQTDFSVNYSRGSTLADGYYYRVYVGEFLSDDIVGECNIIAFDYVYNIKGSAIETGTITLPVK